MTATPFDAALFAVRRRAAGTRLGEPLRTLEETGSTNDDALEAAREGAPHGALFVAESQTRGRGRRGHSWTSPPGENLTFSLLLRPAVPPDRVSSLALVAGLAVRAAAAARVAVEVALKWPNDVVVGTRKLSGILVESRLRGGAVEAVVVGVGLNVHTRAWPPEVGAVATSLALLGDPVPSREAALADILRELEWRLLTFEQGGLTGLLPELGAHDALLGARLRVGDTSGTGAGIGGDGALLLRTASGEVQPVTSGTVERE